MTTLQASLDADLLEHPVVGVHLPGNTLGDILADGPTYLCFLRHLGCAFCREMVAEMRLAAEADTNFPRVLFFYQGSSAQGRAFFAKYWPGCPAVADLETTFYQGFHLQRGGFKEMFGARVWAAGIRAFLKGHSVGKPIGDPWLMPGLFLYEDGRMAMVHQFKHAGDHPDFKRLPRTWSACDQDQIGSNP